MCLGRSQAPGRVHSWGSLSLSDSTGIQGWQYHSRSCGPFSTEGILSRASYDPAETAMGLWSPEKRSNSQSIWFKTQHSLKDWPLGMLHIWETLGKPFAFSEPYSYMSVCVYGEDEM